MRQYDRRNDRYAMPRLCKCQEIRRCAALHHDFWLELGEPTNSIERLANNKARIQKEQRIRRKGSDIDRFA